MQYQQQISNMIQTQQLYEQQIMQLQAQAEYLSSLPEDHKHDLYEHHDNHTPYNTQMNADH